MLERTLICKEWIKTNHASRSVLDFNPINAIASHMGYWADEDVNHFVLSQILSNRSGRKPAS